MRGLNIRSASCPDMARPTPTRPAARRSVDAGRPPDRSRSEALAWDGARLHAGRRGFRSCTDATGASYDLRIVEVHAMHRAGRPVVLPRISRRAEHPIWAWSSRRWGSISPAKASSSPARRRREQLLFVHRHSFGCQGATRAPSGDETTPRHPDDLSRGLRSTEGRASSVARSIRPDRDKRKRPWIGERSVDQIAHHGVPDRTITELVHAAATTATCPGYRVIAPRRRAGR